MVEKLSFISIVGEKPSSSQNLSSGESNLMMRALLRSITRGSGKFFRRGGRLS
jgi:hypothetical protein